MSVEPVTLKGRSIRLEPLHENHAAGLLAAADPDTFAYIATRPQAWDLQGFHQYVARLRANPDLQPFAIVRNDTGQAVGTTSYMDIRLNDRGLEIGNTWIGRDQRGTQINPENKYLLLRHAFEALGMVRVQLKCDGRNLLSQRAIARLGAVREGVLRKHLILPDGYIRDTVMFSIISDEWPQIKARLEDRLGYAP